MRWPVLDGVDAEGLLLQPKSRPVARVIALPDADWTPEMLVGLAPGVDPACQFARRLAENGCQVLVPVLIDRGSRLSGNPAIRMTNIPHREFIYRMAFQMGRHIIGYEVQKVLAAVDCFHRGAGRRELPTGVIGYGEGGLVAFYAAAIDASIDAVCVSGYFQARAEAVGGARLSQRVGPAARVRRCGDCGSGRPPAADHRGRPRPGGHQSAADLAGCSRAAAGTTASPPREAVLNEFKRTKGPYEQLKAAGKESRLVTPG